ncbi:MAG: pyruvate dehydrogenase (acetyl-transferring) E1 component subunit alpha, partial [Phycisphaeraceae bacterium]
MTTAQATTAASPAADIPTERLLELTYDMMLIRRFEERTMQSYMQQKIGGFCHIYTGQEATAVGAIAALQDDDPIVTAYRDHGHALARGMHPRYVMAEMFGKIDGCAKGKGGSMHMFDKPNHMFGGHAIVGGQTPLGAGLGFAIAYNGENKVALCFLGDGALDQGAFHESLNLSAIWNLPVIWAVENNGYSMGTAIHRHTANYDKLHTRAEAYGIRYDECDGLDLMDTYNCIARQAEQCRGSTSKLLGTGEDKGGPAFVNIKTYRYQGHSMSDPQKYRTKEEVAGYEQEQDPINRLVNHMIEREMLTQEQSDELDREAKDLAKDAVKYANEAEDTPLDELFTDVYANPFPPFKRGELPEIMTQADGEQA